MHGVEAARLVVSTKNYEFLSSHCGCRMVRTWFWGRSNNVGCCPYPASHVQYTNSVEPLGTTDTAKKNQLVRRREECRRVAATTRWNVPRCGRRVPKHDFRVENAESIAGGNLFLFGSFPFDRINGFSPKGNNLLPAGDVGSGMPLPSLSSAVDGFVPRTSVLGIINVHIRQDDRIALGIKGLSSVHQNPAIRHSRHGVPPSRGGCGIGKRAGSGRTRACTGCCNHIYSNGGNVLRGILVVRVTVCHVGIGIGRAQSHVYNATIVGILDGGNRILAALIAIAIENVLNRGTWCTHARDQIVCLWSNAMLVHQRWCAALVEMVGICVDLCQLGGLTGLAQADGRKRVVVHSIATSFRIGVCGNLGNFGNDVSFATGFLVVLCALLGIGFSRLLTALVSVLVERKCLLSR
mmetsp:Transcript_1256/g.3195  ORF Transcript_1256/g.3195 Transcript_1256/m.3195 type:complete len:408 (-) Transcript_1256:567-1790(-)